MRHHVSLHHRYDVIDIPCWDIMFSRIFHAATSVPFIERKNKLYVPKTNLSKTLRATMVIGDE